MHALAIHGTGDASSRSAARALRKIGLKSKDLDSTAGDAALDEERKMYTRDGVKEPGFAGAIVPTLEEKLVAERRPPKAQADDAPLAEKVEDTQDANADDKASDDTNNNSPPQARAEGGQLFGAPADASRDANTDDQPPHARSEVDDADEEEQAAPGARSLLRKHLTSKVGNNPWTLPTPAPKVDRNGFEDPISDEFWKNVWLACAVHNVCAFHSYISNLADLF